MSIGLSIYAAQILDGAIVPSGLRDGSDGDLALDTATTLLRTRATISTSLRFPVGPTETTIPVASTEGFATNGAVVIDGECVTYSVKTDSEFLGCSRGQFIDDGFSSAAGHEIGSEVRQEPLPANVRVLADAVRALQARVELVLVKTSVNAQTGTAYTLAQADWGRLVTCNNSSAVTVTIPSAVPVGFRCRVARLGAGSVTVLAATTGSVKLNGTTGGSKTVAARYGVVEIIGIAANEYLITGDVGA